MKFKSKAITIHDEEWLSGITFSEHQDLGSETKNMSIDEIVESTGRYLLLQHSYPEDDFDTHNYHFETSDYFFDGNLVEYEMVLSRTHFEFKTLNRSVLISINPSDEKFALLKKILPLLTNGNGKLVIN